MSRNLAETLASALRLVFEVGLFGTFLTGVYHAICVRYLEWGSEAQMHAAYGAMAFLLYIAVIASQLYIAVIAADRRA